MLAVVLAKVNGAAVLAAVALAFSVSAAKADSLTGPLPLSQRRLSKACLQLQKDANRLERLGDNKGVHILVEQAKAAGCRITLYRAMMPTRALER